MSLFGIFTRQQQFNIQKQQFHLKDSSTNSCKNIQRLSWDLGKTFPGTSNSRTTSFTLELDPNTINKVKNKTIIQQTKQLRVQHHKDMKLLQAQLHKELQALNHKLNKFEKESSHEDIPQIPIGWQNLLSLRDTIPNI